jgi:hypothetical protein
MNILHRLIAMASAALALNAVAYEPITHSEMSQRAAVRSVLANGKTFAKFGLDDKPVSFQTQKFPDSNLRNKTILDLMRFGAAWEDDLGFMQATRHFYNPVNGSKLLPLVGETSPDWALEDNGLKDGQPFSYRLMRSHFLKALTDSVKADRDIAWGSTFQTMGHVMHHLQDMAQPQHVRADSHCDAAFCQALSVFGAYSPSVFEKRIETNLPPSGNYPAVYSEVDTETFNTPRKFWHTNPPGGQATGKGIAEFTNHNFISQGTNFDKPNLFPAPKLLAIYQEEKTITELCAEPGANCGVSGLSGLVTFWGNLVKDAYTGELVQNPRMTTLSVFDDALKKAGKSQVFSYNRFNADAAAKILVPRAVGYSAGMINYFFRGDIDLIEDTAQPGTQLVVNNTGEAMSGKFSLYYDNEAENRFLHQSWTLDIPAYGQVNIGVVTPPTGVALKKAGEYMLVFSGDMGLETRATYGVGAVTGKVVNVAPTEVSYFYSAKAANPSTCRRLSIFKSYSPPPVPPVRPAQPSVSWVNVTSPSSPPNEGTSGPNSVAIYRYPLSYNDNGIVVALSVGVATTVTTANGVGSYSTAVGVPVFGIAPSLATKEINGILHYITYNRTTISGGIVVSEEPLFTPVPETADSIARRLEYPNLLAAYDAAYVDYQTQLSAWQATQLTRVVLSDGTELASFRFGDDGNGNTTNYPYITRWSGDGWVQLFNRSAAGVYSEGTRLTFVVPADVCHPFDGSGAPAYPGGTNSQWTADWAAARAVADVRERARRKLVSDAVKRDLEMGNLPDTVKKILRNRPLSSNAYIKTPITVSVQNSTTGAGDNMTETKMVTLSYMAIGVQGQSIPRTQTISGTKQIRTMRNFMDSIGNSVSNKAFTTTTYTNWLPIEPDGATELGDYTYVMDDGRGLAQIQNGVVISGAASFVDTLDTYGGPYTPALPLNSDTRTYSYPQIYRDFRREAPREFDSALWQWYVEYGDDPDAPNVPPMPDFLADGSWLDSAFINGEKLDVFPLTTIHSALGDLGLFPNDADIKDQSKLTLRSDLKITYQYNYLSGQWTLIDATSRNGTSPLAYKKGANFVFRSATNRRDLWPDVVPEYDLQAQGLATSPMDYPLFADIKAKWIDF